MTKLNYKVRIWMKCLFMCFLVAALSLTVSAGMIQYNLTYDSIGNMQQGFSKNFEYDDFNQLARVHDFDQSGPIIEEYLYDHEGERAVKYNPEKDETMYYVNENFIMVVNATGTFNFTHYYENGVHIGRKDSDEKKYFYHPDHLGSTDTVTNATGNIVEKTTYKPYGQVEDGGASRFLFAGKERDVQTGLDYLGARYYDSFFRHFTQPDVNVPELYNPQDLNRYAYVRNNPYKYVDPNGEFAITAAILTGAAIGFGIGVGTDIVSQLSSNNFDIRDVNVIQAAKTGGFGAIGGSIGGGVGAGVGSIASSAGLSRTTEIAGTAVLSSFTSIQGERIAENLVTGRPPLEGTGPVGNAEFTVSVGQSLVESVLLKSAEKPGEISLVDNINNERNKQNKLDPSQNELAIAISIGRGIEGRDFEERTNILLEQGRHRGSVRDRQEKLIQQGRG